MELEKDFSSDSILISVDAGVFGVMSSAIAATDFCPIATLSTATNDDRFANDDQDACPSSGFYSISTYFILSSFEVDQNVHYVPDLCLKIYNATSSEMAVIGCAQTGTMAAHFNSSTHATMGLVALGISLLVLGTCFGIMLYLTYRRKKRLELELKEKRHQSNVRNDFPYVRTTSHGRVVIPTSASSSRSQ